MKRTARFFKALSDHTRLQILWLLFRKGQASLRDIQNVLDIPEVRAANHLKYLANAGVIQSRQEGDDAKYKVMQQTDEFRRATLEGLRCRICEQVSPLYLEQKLGEWLSAQEV